MLQLGNGNSNKNYTFIIYKNSLDDHINEILQTNAL